MKAKPVALAAVPSFPQTNVQRDETRSTRIKCSKSAVFSRNLFPIGFSQNVPFGTGKTGISNPALVDNFWGHIQALSTPEIP